MTDKNEPKKDAKPAAPAKPAPKKPVLQLPDPIFNESAGRLLHADRIWPTDVWPNRWRLPRYRNGAIILAALILVPLGLSALIGELSQFTGPIMRVILRLLAAAGVPAGWHGAASMGIWTVIKVVLVLSIVLASPIFIVWWERKISAHMQSRFGPMYTGGFHGWLQTVADGIKLFLKENITPLAADKWVHRLAPPVVVAPAILAFAPVSFGRELAAADIDVGVIYVFAMAGISVVGIMMAGWGSGNKYSLLGGLRAAAQLVSYEIPRTFSVVPVIMFAGSLNLTKIAEAQAGYWPMFVFAGPEIIPRWFIFYPVVGQIAFLIFLIASVAETNRIPFDIPEAESELVAGFHTEYSAMKFALFFLAEYAYVFLASCLTAAFFLGGGSPPLPALDFIPSWAWFLSKVIGVVFVFLWFRWTFPRFRVDRLMDFNWKFLLPWTFANIAFAGLYLLF